MFHTSDRDVCDVKTSVYLRDLRINLVSCVNWGPGYLSRYSDWLRAGRSGDRIPARARFFANVQICPGDHPASCTMGTGSFPGVKRQGRGADNPPPSSPEVKKE
jgi:hypothetical protein